MRRHFGHSGKKSASDFDNRHHPRQFASEWLCSYKDEDVVKRITYDVMADNYGTFMYKVRRSVANDRDLGYTEIVLPVKEKSSDCVSTMLRNRNLYTVSLGNGKDMFEIGFAEDGKRHFEDAFFTGFGEYYRDMLGSDSLYGRTISRALFRERVLAIVKHPNDCSKWKLSAGLFALMISEPGRFRWMSDVTTWVMAMNIELSFTGRFAWMAWMPKRWTPISSVARLRPRDSDVLTKQRDVKTNKGAEELLHNRVWSDNSLWFLTWVLEESEMGVQQTIKMRRKIAKPVSILSTSEMEMIETASKRQKISENSNIPRSIVSTEMECKSRRAWCNAEIVSGARSSSSGHARPRGITSVDLSKNTLDDQLKSMCIAMVEGNRRLHEDRLQGPRKYRVFSDASLNMSNIKLLMEPYYTTLKEGTRCWMLITSDACYAIDKEFNSCTLLPCLRKDADDCFTPRLNTFVDGEILWADKQMGKMTYLVSDVIGTGTISHVHEPFDKRFGRIEKDVIAPWSRLFSSELLKLERKKFYPLRAVPRLVKETIPNQSYVYDSLIFHPMYLPFEPGRILKWKFPELNPPNDPPEDEILREIKKIIHDSKYSLKRFKRTIH